MIKRIFQSRWLDRIAVLLSGLCAIHCFGGLFLLLFLSEVSDRLSDPRIHEIGLALAVLFALLGLGGGFLSHHKWRPVVIGGVGIVFMSVGLFVGHSVAEDVCTVIGVSLVACAHLMNHRVRRHSCLH